MNEIPRNELGLWLLAALMLTLAGATAIVRQTAQSSPPCTCADSPKV